jgi:protein gp37
MAENSKIEWTHHTFNPWVGCTKISPGCDHCYAEGWAKRSGQVKWGNHPRKRTSSAYWSQPLKWAKAAREATNKWLSAPFSQRLEPPPRPRVFCASLADVFDNQVPAEWRTGLFDLIEKTPELDWLLLTKRPENIEKMLPAESGGGIANIWLGTTCEDQERFDRRWSILLEVSPPPVVRFVSYEPAIGPLRLAVPRNFEPDWLICGGESGHGARQMDLQWARDIRDECAERDVKFFFKQTTGKGPIPDDLMVRQFPGKCLGPLETKSAAA